MSNRSRSRAPADLAEEQAELDTICCAVAHVARRQVLLVLHFRGGEMTAGDIADRFSCSWPTMSRHLKVLERAGLVASTRRGRERVYRLNHRLLTRVLGGWLKWFGTKAN